MTPDEIRTRVGEIEANKFEDEEAHRMEKHLWRDVLTDIANGDCADPKACARAALTTSKVDFGRWYT